MDSCAFCGASTSGTIYCAECRAELFKDAELGTVDRLERVQLLLEQEKSFAEPTPSKVIPTGATRDSDTGEGSRGRSVAEWRVLLVVCSVRRSVARELGANLLLAAVGWAGERGLATSGTMRLPREDESADDLCCEISLTAIHPGQTISESQAGDMLEWLHRWASTQGLAVRGGIDTAQTNGT
jgi:hypothetical protein